MKEGKMKWKIWFDQVNQQVFEVEARTEESAIRKAKSEWRNSNSFFLEPSYIEKVKEELEPL